tara:strand:- start:7131 stop:7793 length:663 start_codon:yes stop_codon:yes gene_type:complete
MKLKTNKQTHSSVRSLFLFKRNKKAFKLVLTNLIGILLAVIILVATSYFFVKVGKLYFGEEGQKSEATLRRLSVDISEMEDNEAKIFSGFYLENNYYFNDYQQGTGIIKATGEKVLPPNKCLDNSCMCICEKEDCCDTEECTGKVSCILLGQGTDITIPRSEIHDNRDKIVQLHICKKNKNYIEIEMVTKDKTFEQFKDECKGKKVSGEYTLEIKDSPLS